MDDLRVLAQLDAMKTGDETMTVHDEVKEIASLRQQLAAERAARLDREAFAVQLQQEASKAKWRIQELESALTRAWGSNDAKLQTERDVLRAALVGMVGTDDLTELDQMEAVIRASAAPGEDRTIALNAFHALRQVRGKDGAK